jgi:hypothetical protein
MVMGRTLFIGDSHTMGYKSVPNSKGIGSFTQWNDNNYAEIYQGITGKPIVIYALSGASNRIYTDWLRTMFDMYDDIDEVFICLASFNRFIIAHDDITKEECIPSDFFTFKLDNSTESIHRYMDGIVRDDVMQLLNKSIYSDYDKYPGVEFSSEDGLITPDIRKHSYMQVKLFFELNTYIEKRDFLNCIYTWDNICADHGANLHLFNFTNRLKFPSTFDYYGKLKNTRIANKTVETYLKQMGIDHSQYLIEDREHYNKQYHEFVAKNYIPWLQTLKKF